MARCLGLSGRAGSARTRLISGMALEVAVGHPYLLFSLQQVEQDDRALLAVAGDEDGFDIGEAATADLDPLARLEGQVRRALVPGQALSQLFDQLVE